MSSRLNQPELNIFVLLLVSYEAAAIELPYARVIVISIFMGNVKCNDEASHIMILFLNAFTKHAQHCLNPGYNVVLYVLTLICINLINN